MARRDAAEVLAEAFAMADSHIREMAAAGCADLGLPRDVLALNVCLLIIRARDELDRKIRKVGKRVRAAERRQAEIRGALGLEPLPPGEPRPAGERRLVELSDDGWVRARIGMTRMDGLGGMLSGREGTSDG